MRRTIWAVVAGVLLGGVACAKVVAVKMPNQDPHPQAFYTCEPDGTSFKCDSAQTLHQYDLQLEPSQQKCENGIYQVHVKTNWHGGISEVQYQCALARGDIGGFPAVAPSASAAAAGGQAGSH